VFAAQIQPLFFEIFQARSLKLLLQAELAITMATSTNHDNSNHTITTHNHLNPPLPPPPPPLPRTRDDAYEAAQHRLQAAGQLDLWRTSPRKAVARDKSLSFLRPSA
jgi:hypothetical protein